MNDLDAEMCRMQGSRVISHVVEDKLSHCGKGVSINLLSFRGVGYGS